MHKCQDERELWGYYSNLLLPSILSIHLCLWFHLQNLLRRESRSIDCIYSLLTKLNLSCTLLTKIKSKISIKLKLIFPFALILTFLLWKMKNFVWFYIGNFLYTYKNVMIDVRRKRPKTSLLLSQQLFSFEEKYFIWR